MHELSIANSIFDIVKQYVPDERRSAVRGVRVRVGELAGVVPDSLAFCFEAIRSEWNMDEAELDIEFVPYTLHCIGCAEDIATRPGIVVCPSCGKTDTKVVSGTELHVVDIELSDEEVSKP